MERPFSSKVIDAVYSGYSGDHFDPDAAIDAVLELLPEPTVEEVAHAIYDCTGLNRAVPEDAREIAIAVLSLIGGRTEAQVKAEALREVADEYKRAGEAPNLWIDLNRRARQIEREG